MNDDEIGDRDRLRDGREVAHCIVREVFVRRRIDGQRAQGLQQSVPVRRRLGDHVSAYDGARAGAVVDHYLVSPAFAETLGKQACDHVAAATGHGRHDDAYDAVGITGLGERDSVHGHEHNRRRK